MSRTFPLGLPFILGHFGSSFAISRLIHVFQFTITNRTYSTTLENLLLSKLNFITHSIAPQVGIQLKKLTAAQHRKYFRK